MFKIYSFIDAVSKASTPNNRGQHYLRSVDEKSNNYTPYTKASECPIGMDSGAYGLVVMTSPSHGGGRRFKSG